MTSTELFEWGKEEISNAKINKVDSVARMFFKKLESIGEESLAEKLYAHYLKVTGDE